MKNYKAIGATLFIVALALGLFWYVLPIKTAQEDNELKNWEKTALVKRNNLCEDITNNYCHFEYNNNVWEVVPNEK